MGDGQVMTVHLDVVFESKNIDGSGDIGGDLIVIGDNFLGGGGNDNHNRGGIAMSLLITGSVDTFVIAEVVLIGCVGNGLAFVGDGADAVISGEENSYDVEGKAVQCHVVFKDLDVNGGVDGGGYFIVVGVNGLSLSIE